MYIDNERLMWLGARAFDSEEHFGKALTEKELEERKALEEEYKVEIGLAEAMLKANPKFEGLSMENKINLAGNLILKLKEINIKEEKTKK